MVTSNLELDLLNPLKNGDTRAAPQIPAHNEKTSAPTHDYENLVRPIRPAPPRPPAMQSTYSTITSFHGLEGVPFVMNTKLINFSSIDLIKMPAIKSRTLLDIDDEFNYDFRLERQTISCN